MAASKNGRLLSTGSNKVDGALGDQQPSMDKILVFGGNGFVGSHICIEVAERGLTVHSLSSYSILVTGDPSSPDSLKSAMTGVTAVV